MNQREIQAPLRSRRHALGSLCAGALCGKLLGMKIHFWLASVCLLGLPICATASPANAPTVSAATVQSMVNRVLKETSQLRGLSILRPVKSGVQTRAGVEAMIRRQLAGTSSDELLASQLFLTQLGLAPRDFDLKKSTTSLLGEQVAGYYDPRSGTFYTSDHISTGELETVMAHELTHALQDQHFDLKRLENGPQHNSDARIALAALVEGDATLVMSRYMAANPFRFLGMLGSALMPHDSTAFNATPRALRESLLFPYMQGLSFNHQLVRMGGEAAVSRAFARLPKSTQQVMHFELYLRDKQPIPVPLRDVRPQLGKGWKLLDYDVNGEEGSALVLSQFLPDKAEVEAATKGWAGDRFAVYQGPNKAVLVVQDTLWDSNAAAQKWRDAYAKRTTTRFSGHTSEVTIGTLTRWNDGHDDVWLEGKGRRVVVLEGTYGGFDSAKVLAALQR